MGDGKTYRKQITLTKVIILCSISIFVGYMFGSYYSKNGDLKRIRTSTMTKMVLDVDGETASPGALRHAQVIRIDDDNSDNIPRVSPPPTVATTKVVTNDIDIEVEIELDEVGTSGDQHFTELKFQVLSQSPRAVMYRNFASSEDCDSIVKAASSRLHKSGLALKKGETVENTKNIRTSSGTFLTSMMEESGALKRVEDKMARATHVPANYGEAYNILRYEIGQKYDSHYDTFDPQVYGEQKSKRIASFLLYLTTPDEGGETVFPLEGPNGLNRLRGIDYAKCDIGLKVKPRKGDALLFWSVYPNMTFDRASLHGGCAVKSGEKYVATKWIHDTLFS